MSASSAPEYGVWAMMRQRCSNPKNAKYPRYGGRGIRVCSRWESYANFIADMGPKPGPGYSLDRIDNDAGYEPGNCRWATAQEQSLNRSTCFEARGLSRTVEFDCLVCGSKVARNRKYAASSTCSRRCAGIKAGQASGASRRGRAA